VEGGDCRVQMFQSLDMKGYFPSSLLNMVSSSIMTKGTATTYTKLLDIQAKIDKGEI